MRAGDVLTKLLPICCMFYHQGLGRLAQSHGMFVDQKTRALARLPRAEVTKSGRMPSVSKGVLIGLIPLHGVWNLPLPSPQI